MRNIRLAILLSVTIGNLVLSATVTLAQVKVFFDPPKISVAPQDIITDEEFTDDLGEAREEDQAPAGALKIDVSPGEVLQVPVIIVDGAEDIVSYALRVLYNKNVLRILEITGGTFPGFAAAPVTHPAAFTSGKTDFTAYNTNFGATPDNFQVAVIRFEVIGRPKQQTTIRLRKTPQSDIVALDTFEPSRRVHVQKGIRVQVQ